MSDARCAGQRFTPRGLSGLGIKLAFLGWLTVYPLSSGTRENNPVRTVKGLNNQITDGVIASPRDVSAGKRGVRFAHLKGPCGPSNFNSNTFSWFSF